MEGMLPSYVKEGADRAFRYALARANGEQEHIKLTTQDFVNAAIGLRPQLDLMEGAKERALADPIGTQMGRLFTETMATTLVDDIVKQSVREELDGKVK
jgi:hypothetical protein